MKERMLFFTVLFVTLTSYSVFSQWKYLSKYDGQYLTVVSSYYYGMAYFDSILWVGAGNLWLSSDFGENWERKSLAMLSEAKDIIKIKNRILVSGSYGNVISDNNGNNWEVRNNGLPSSFNIMNYLKLKDSLLFGVTHGGIYFSSDFGNNWIYKSNGTNATNNLIAKGDTLIASSNNKGVFFSTNFGESWETKSSGLTYIAVYDVQYLEDKIYAATFGGGLCISTNSGDSWKGINGDSLPPHALRVLPYKDYIFVGTDEGLYVTTNGGVNWKRKDLTKYTRLFTKLLIIGDYLYCGVGGNSGVWKVNIDYLTGIKDEPDWEYVECTYPNPASSFVRIETDFLENPKIEIYNILGNKVELPFSQTNSNNKLTFEFNTSQLPTSTYFYKISNGTRNYTGKFIKE